MMHLLAQATQPSEWVWTNISPEKLALWIALWSAAVMGGVVAIQKLGTLLISVWFGWKKTAKQQMEELQGQVQANAQATATLIDANKKNPKTADVPADVEAVVRSTANRADVKE